MLRVTQRVLSVRTTLPVLRQRVPTLAFGRVGAAALPFTPVPCRFAAMGAPPGSNPGDDPAMKVSSEHNPFYGDPFMPREEVLKRIVLVVKNFDKVANPDAVTETSHFVKDLGLDSLDVVEVRSSFRPHLRPYPSPL